MELRQLVSSQWPITYRTCRVRRPCNSIYTLYENNCRWGCDEFDLRVVNITSTYHSRKLDWSLFLTRPSHLTDHARRHHHVLSAFYSTMYIPPDPSELCTKYNSFPANYLYPPEKMRYVSDPDKRREDPCRWSCSSLCSLIRRLSRSSCFWLGWVLALWPCI